MFIFAKYSFKIHYVFPLFLTSFIFNTGILYFWNLPHNKLTVVQYVKIPYNAKNSIISIQKIAKLFEIDLLQDQIAGKQR